MAKAMRWLGYGLGGILLLLVLAAIAVWLLSERAIAQRVAPGASNLAVPTAQQLADGPRMLRVNGCVSCHGEGLRGKLFFDEPGVGRVHAPNLALLAKSASDAQLDRAIRQGIGHDGRSLWIMPSAGYQFLTDEESAALIAAIRALPAGGQEMPPISLGPLGRIGILNGSLVPQPEKVAEYRRKPVPALGADFERGRHLTQINCSDCHGTNLAGKEVEPGVVSADLSIVGAYDRDQFGKLLATGEAPSGKDLGLMKQVSRNDFRHLTADEVDAIHAYLVELANRGSR